MQRSQRELMADLFMEQLNDALALAEPELTDQFVKLLRQTVDMQVRRVEEGERDRLIMKRIDEILEIPELREND